MANYVLSPGAARRLRELMRGRMTSGRIDGDASHVVDERDFEHPYKLTYAASAGAVDEETGESAGAWIIWLPDGCLVIDGETVDLTADMTEANRYPEGWYDLTDIFDGTDPEDFELYLDASKDDPKFVLDPDDAEHPVLIAKVEGKAVKGIVESALVYGHGQKHPWQLRKFPETEEGSGDEWRVWIPKEALFHFTGSTIKTAVASLTPSGSGGSGEVVTGPSFSMWKWGSDSFTGEVDDARTEDGGVWASVAVPEGGGVVYVLVQAGFIDLHFSVTLSVATFEGWTNINAHPEQHTAGFYVPVAQVSSGGTITQYVTSAIVTVKPENDFTKKFISGGRGINVQESATRITISATGGGGGSSSGGGHGDDDDDYIGVDSLNALTGALNIIGGEGIEVSTDRETKTIKISFREGKEEDETPTPTNSCEHPGDGGFGGGGGVGAGGGGGGVAAGGDTHIGDDECCCE